MSPRWSWHGGGITAARAHFGDGAEPWIDLSTGINPHAWPNAGTIDINWRALPDDGALRALEHTAASHFGVSPHYVCATPGSEAGLRLIGGILPGPAFHLVPSYRTHGEMAAGSMPVTAESMDKTNGATLILANPNNPDGRLWDQTALLKQLTCRGNTGWLIIDEAFADCHPQQSMAAFVSNESRLIVLRSFGKFFGLAGLRLGFIIGPDEILGAVRQKLGAWPVSSAAIAIGTAAYQDTAWITATRNHLARDADKLDAMLRKCGFSFTGACPLFRLIVCDNAMALFKRLAKQSILTRPFDDNPNWLRIGLTANAHDLARLEHALCHG